jgi:hypothetical protein
MKACGEVDAWIHVFLTSEPVVGEWSASCPGRFTSGERALYPLKRRLCEPQTLYGRRGEEKNLAPTKNRTPTPRWSSLR